jgi:hypothetical protein
MRADCIWYCRRIHAHVQIHIRIGVRVGTSVIGQVVDVEGTNVREEVLVREGVVFRRDAVNSRAEALPKNLIVPHPYRFTRGGVLGAYCPIVQSTPEEGMEKV